MNRSLEPFLPALDNAPIFLVAVVLLVALLLVSVAARFVRMADLSAGRWLGVAKFTTAVLNWSLLTFWLVIGAGLVAFAGAVGGSLVIVVVGVVAFLIVFPLLTILLVAWSRGRAWADWLIICLVAGFSTAVFTTQRLWICEPLAWSGFTPAQMCTARLYAEGSHGAIRNTGVAASWYGQAALNGSEEAVSRLVTVTRNKLIQRKHLENAALAGNGAATYQLFVLLGPQEGMRWLHVAIENRHPDALYQQSRYMMTGEHDFPWDIELANALWEESAELGSSSAAAALALAYETGDRAFGYSRVRSLYWEARVDEYWQGYARWLAQLERHRERRDRVAEGDPEAILALAREYQSRASRDPAYEQDAHEWLAQAAEAGATEAQFELAFIYFRRSDGTEEDLANARRWLTAAADQGHRYALSNISHYLTNGQYGFQIDLRLARDYAATLFTLLSSESRPHAGDLRLAQARHEEIEIRLERQNVWEDGLEALEARASAGEADALYQLYEKHSQDRERGDRAIAETLLRSAAEKGHAESRYRIAKRTLSQPRTPDEEALAYQWMQDAADQGHRGALVVMGSIYLRGLPKYGIEKNPEAARTALERALEGLEGDVVYARRNGSMTVATKRESVERMLANIEVSTVPH